MDERPIESRAALAAAEVLGVSPEAVSVQALPGHASARRYFRVGADRRSLVVMALPPDAARSEEASKDEAPDELPFLNVQRYLYGLGVRVPEIHRADLDAGLVVLEDLGDRTMEDALLEGPDPDRARRRLYGKAVDGLAFLRAQADAEPDPACLAWQRAFDYDLLRWELDHFLEWGLEAGHGGDPTPAERAVISDSFDAIARRLADLPRGFVHRDYQSRNLMVGADGELAVIDFQDALQGPLVYDLVALLRDSYVVLPWDLVETMKDRFLDGLRALGRRAPEREDLDEAFDLQTVQRKLKDAGRFEFIARVKHNDAFLPHVPASLGYAREALGRLGEYARLQEVLARYVPGLAP